MKGTVLITGGAGFIGSHVAAELLRAGYHVRVLDSLVTQVHGERPDRPAYLRKDATFMLGDVRNPDIVDQALSGVDATWEPMNPAPPVIKTVPFIVSLCPRI
jgi:dTDP-L-rhamnose 4-epimerase